MVKLKSSLPPGELNGLYDIATDAVACPSRVRLVVGLVEVPEVRKNIRKGLHRAGFRGCPYRAVATLFNPARIRPACSGYGTAPAALAV